MLCDTAYATAVLSGIYAHADYDTLSYFINWRQ